MPHHRCQEPVAGLLPQVWQALQQVRPKQQVLPVLAEGVQVMEAGRAERYSDRARLR